MNIKLFEDPSYYLKFDPFIRSIKNIYCLMRVNYNIHNICNFLYIFFATIAYSNIVYAYSIKS